jgi:hypothetical protein
MDATDGTSGCSVCSSVTERGSASEARASWY